MAGAKLLRFLKSTTMPLYMPLPNELLHSIVEYAAYPINGVTDFYEAPNMFKHPSPELVALSVADWRLRRVCMPFLFANIAVRCIPLEDAARLEKDLAALSRYIKFLRFGECACDSISQFHDKKSRRDEIIIQILRQLNHLSNVEFSDCKHDTVLFRALLAHPSVTSVLVYQIPGESMCDTDLSKVILWRQTSDWIFSPESDKYLSRGIRLLRLELMDIPLNSPHYQYRSKDFTGLQKIEMRSPEEDVTSVSYLCLSMLLSTHPTLNELWLFYDPGEYLICDAPPFISSFVEEFRRQKLRTVFYMHHVGFRKTNGRSSQHWCVIGLTLTVKSLGSTDASLTQLFKPLASSFPKVKQLSLLFSSNSKHIYHVNDLATALGQFSSLNELSINNVLERLEFFERNKSLPPIRQVDSTDASDAQRARVETGLLWYASLLAKEVRSLDTFHINDQCPALDSYRGGYWYSVGFRVTNGNRDVCGILTLPSYKGSRNVLLETRLLPPGFM
ncbi:hypothetical protein F5880DRAFT_1562845 [Lentinula raphanica]|nr:hypothetical protein F5880DRAFT_1562845 [Lentinula raphanica]